jgi:hypothetical protein
MPSSKKVAGGLQLLETLSFCGRLGGGLGEVGDIFDIFPVGKRVPGAKPESRREKKRAVVKQKVEIEI